MPRCLIQNRFGYVLKGIIGMVCVSFFRPEALAKKRMTAFPFLYTCLPCLAIKEGTYCRESGALQGPRVPKKESEVTGNSGGCSSSTSLSAGPPCASRTAPAKFPPSDFCLARPSDPLPNLRCMQHSMGEEKFKKESLSYLSRGFRTGG